MEKFEKRMYFFVPYQLTGIQQGIQSGHSALRFALRYGRYNPNHIIWDFIENYQTWVILNGGTTSNDLDAPGTLDSTYRSLRDNDIDCTGFCEPDLNNALTAVCFICDERVFNKKLYPDFIDFMANEVFPEIVESDYSEDDFIDAKLNRDYEVYKYKNKFRFQNISKFPEYKEWIKSLGGEKNVFLRELIKDKKLA